MGTSLQVISTLSMLYSASLLATTIDGENYANVGLDALYLIFVMLTISFHATKKIEVFLTAKNNATQEKTVLLQLKKTENSPNIPFSIFFPQFFSFFARRV